MSEYTKRATIRCPTEQVSDLNQLSGVWGLSIADASYFGAANYIDGDGAQYCVRSAACTEDWLTRAVSGELQRPEWDIETQQLDLVAAARAQALLRIHPEPIEDAPYIVQTDPGEIVALIDPDPLRAIAALELTLIETGAV